MKTGHKLFFAIPFDSATKNLYDRICRKIRKRHPEITTVIGKQEVGPSPEYSDFASFKAQNRELTRQFVAQIMDADIVIAEVGIYNNPLSPDADERKKAFEEAGIRHDDVDHLMIYDAFAHLPIYGLEDLGFVGRGEAGAFIWERNTAEGGKLPLNTNGGGLSYMHSGMYGMYALQESVRQLRGSAAAQVPDAEISFALGVGGMFSASGAIILSNS